MQQDEADLGLESVDSRQKQLEVVVYQGSIKIVGMAYFGARQRTSSRRASDYIRQFAESRLTLSNARIYAAITQELLETAPFVVVNMDKVDLVYAREHEDSTSS